MNSKNKNGLKGLGQLGAYVNSGLSMAIALLVWLGIGYMIDAKLDTSPLFLLIGVAMGMVTVFYELYKLIKVSMKMEKQDQENHET